MKICPCCGKPTKNCKKKKAEWYQRNKKSVLKKINGQYQENRKLVIEQLGGVCSYPGCNCTVDLQLDHINPLEKEFNIYRVSSSKTPETSFQRSRSPGQWGPPKPRHPKHRRLLSAPVMRRRRRLIPSWYAPPAWLHPSKFGQASEIWRRRAQLARAVRV